MALKDGKYVCGDSIVLSLTEFEPASENVNYSVTHVTFGQTGSLNQAMF